MQVIGIELAGRMRLVEAVEADITAPKDKESEAEVNFPLRVLIREGIYEELEIAGLLFVFLVELGLRAD